MFKVSTEFGLNVVTLKPRQIHEDQVTHDFVDVSNNRSKLDFNRIIFLKKYSILVYMYHSYLNIKQRN